MIIYGEKEINYISSKDEVMKDLVMKYGHLEKGQVTDVFESLVLHIIGQLLSNKVSKTIINRFIMACIGRKAAAGGMKHSGKSYGQKK